MDRTTLTANLKPLERQGLVETAVDPADGRGRLLVLTTGGRKRLKAALPVWQRTHAGSRAARADPTRKACAPACGPWRRRAALDAPLGRRSLAALGMTLRIG